MSENEQPSVEKIIEYFNSALEDLRETEDYISYATVLDVYLSDSDRYSDEEKCTLLRALYGILEANLDIVQEIGWDLPELLLKFFQLDWSYEGSLLRSNDNVKLVMHGFDIVAKNGNAKEVFIKSIELLGSLDYASAKDKRSETIVDLQVYSLMELLSCSLKRINTIYPSKFLAMSLSGLLNAYTQYIEHIYNTRFIIRRLYTFVRDYIPPLKPNNYLEQHGITPEEAQKIEDDENYLQAVLLQSFVTNIVGISGEKRSMFFSMRLYNDLKAVSKDKEKPTHVRGEEQLTSSIDTFLRVLTLAVSFDIDPEEEFENLKKDAKDLLKRVDESKSEDEKIQDLIKFSVNDRVESLHHSESKTIPRNQLGLLYLSVLYFYDSEKEPNISIQEAVALHIRFLSPGLLSPEFQGKGTLDCILYFDWFAITQATPEELNELPHYQLIIFLQSIIYYSSTEEDSGYRIVLFTLLVRVLSMVHESVAYDFLVDTLTTAPFENAKAAVINILKDLCLRYRPDVDSLAKKLADSSLDETKPAAPELPQRRYIQLNNERIEDLYALIRECIDETFSSEVVEGGRFKTLLGYLNFLIGVKDQFPKDKLQEIVDETEKKLATKPEINDNSTNLEFATLVCDSLKTYLGN